MTYEQAQEMINLLQNIILSMGINTIVLFLSIMFVAIRMGKK